MVPTDLLGRRFRAASDFELVSLERLSDFERVALADLQQRKDVFGVLKPCTSHRSIKVVDPETALLLLALREPGPLPHFARMRLRDAAPLYQLVLDSVLEVELNGEFVSGPRAYGELAPLASLALDGTHVAELSMRAVRYCATIEVDDPVRVSSRLYCYQRVPPTPRWARVLGGTDRMLSHRLTPQGPALRDRIRDAWTRSEEPGWTYCTRTTAARRATYKLYVSPAPEATLDSIHTVAALLADTAAHGFKFGREMLGMLRPDKFVAYFGERDAMLSAAERVGSAIAGTPAQGVPFSAQLGDTALVSWGADPPRTEQLVGWQERPSWRMWVTNRLAVALIAARTAFPTDAERRAVFALERLRLEGVDVRTWTPAIDLFQAS